MRRKTMIIWAGIGAVAVLGAALWGPIVSNVEQAKYTVTEKYETIEIRDYAPMVVAEVETQGERDPAISDGFRLLADYIFGGNVGSQKVEMTAPVIQQKNEKIAMTAPVMQESTGSNRWKVQFVMPSEYTIESLPKPSNPAVKLKQVAGKRFAAIRFSGFITEDNIHRHEEQLEQFLKEKGLEPLGPATYAFFNPPWTLPFLRRNEVMVEIKK